MVSLVIIGSLGKDCAAETLVSRNGRWVLAGIYVTTDANAFVDALGLRISQSMVLMILGKAIVGPIDQPDAQAAREMLEAL